MANNNWNSRGEDFLSAVESAINTGDFLNISRYVGDLVNDAIDAAKSNVYTRSARPAGAYASSRPSAQEPDGLQNRLYTRWPGGKIAGILLIVFGFLLAGISLLLLALFCAISTRFLLIVPIVIFAVLTALGAFMGFGGIRKIAFVNRFIAYTRNLGSQHYIPVKNLAAITRKSISFTNRDLQKMIDKRLFFEGHLDTDNDYLILSDQAYAEYQTAKYEQAARQRELDRYNNDSRLTAECRKMIEEGQAYVDRIRSSNDQIPDRLFSEKLDKMEQVVKKIFDEVRVHPEVAPDLQKMMDYYLPTTAKLLDAYRELDAQPVSGEHITATKKEIETAVDTLNAAFEKLLDSLFANRAWDISSDISVLNTVLAQDGLAKDDFPTK